MATARQILDLLDAGAGLAALRPHFAPRLETWDEAEPWMRRWSEGLDTLLGASRRVVSETAVSPTFTRFELAGDAGTAVATVILDDEGRWFGASLKRRAVQGIGNIVLQCPWNEAKDAMSALYGALLGLDPFDTPVLVFDEGMPDDPRPRWPDPAHPQQMHLDIRVPDLDAADALVRSRGATHLATFDDHVVYADVIGHPFCLYQDDVPSAELWRLVIDGPDPDALAAFYAGVLGTDTTPLLAFQHSDADPPRWPDPSRPAQVHLDVMFDDPAPVAERIMTLGGSVLQRKDGFTVYADPAGHPFCLGQPGA